jgi:hypothetical protein
MADVFSVIVDAFFVMPLAIFIILNQVSSMIEIEVEMDINVLAAEEGAAMV